MKKKRASKKSGKAKRPRDLAASKKGGARTRGGGVFLNTTPIRAISPTVGTTPIDLYKAITSEA